MLKKSGFRRTNALISLKRGKIGPRLLIRSNRNRDCAKLQDSILFESAVPIRFDSKMISRFSNRPCLPITRRSQVARRSLQPICHSASALTPNKPIQTTNQQTSVPVPEHVSGAWAGAAQAYFCDTRFPLRSRSAPNPITCSKTFYSSVFAAGLG